MDQVAVIRDKEYEAWAGTPRYDLVEVGTFKDSKGEAHRYKRGCLHSFDDVEAAKDWAKRMGFEVIPAALVEEDEGKDSNGNASEGKEEGK